MGFIKRMSVPAGLPGSHPVQLRPRDLLDLLQITFPLSQQIVGWSKGNEYPHPFCTGHFFYAPVHWTDDGCSFSMELIIPAVWSQSLQVQPSGAGWRRNKCQDCSWNVTSSLAHKRGLCKAGQRYSFWEQGQWFFTWDKEQLFSSPIFFLPIITWLCLWMTDSSAH